jgi:hypothetical protein
MSDESYDIDGVSRFLQTPPPESHLLAVTAADVEPAAPPVGAPQDPPAGVHQVGLVLQTPPLNPEPAPANNVGNRQAPTMDVEPPPPPPPRDPVPAARATTDPTPSFEALFDDIVLPDLGTMSLYDEFMDDGDDEEVEALIRSVEDAGNTGALAEHSVPPAEEDLDFVPFVRGQLDCSNCRSVREVLHESGKHAHNPMYVL